MCFASTALASWTIVRWAGARSVFGLALHCALLGVLKDVISRYTVFVGMVAVACIGSLGVLRLMGSIGSTAVEPFTSMHVYSSILRHDYLGNSLAVMPWFHVQRLKMAALASSGR
jgi:hypothetical protein